MAREFEMDLNRIDRALLRASEAAGNGAKQAMDGIKDDWVRGARDIAPLDTGNLRRQIAGDVEGRGLDLKTIVIANAAQRDFNYGYYIHEEDAGGKSLKTSGTVKKFLDESADEEKWKRWLEEEIRDAIQREGR